MNVEDFLTKYDRVLDENDWRPTSILNYLEFGFDKNIEFDLLGYITSITKNNIVIDKINWITIDDYSGFDIIDTHKETKYQITKDTQIWLLIQSGGNFQISLEDLISYNKLYSKITIWNILVEKGEVTMLVEQYVP